ncbi:MAG: FAD-dependent oxidoreductase [Treponemataceae bacterium]|nr:FAD-dependent oxidoreductase [Treponemataceae bacterium]
MVTQVSITIRSEDEQKPAFIKDKILLALAEKGIPFRSASEVTPVFVKKSIDARHGRIKLVMRYDVYIGETPKTEAAALPVWKTADNTTRVAIVGAGPAGLFGALRLLEDGIKPIIIERGSVTTERKKDIAAISTRGIVDADSNYCFGEGGAGTFSDGKLYTRSNKRGDIGRILRIFAAFGANPAILTDAHPHIGTDKLPHIINAMRQKIIACGGEFLFDTKCVGFETDGARVTGVKVRGTKTGAEQTIHADAVVLAAGHSANDIYELLARTAPTALAEKTFAVGVRIEHPRELIDSIQFHGKTTAQAAEYRLTAQVDGRGVYSFCMCPGGFIVPSSTASHQIVINGMSSAARNSRWSNSAIVVEVRPEDIPAECRTRAAQDGVPALAGLYWRTQLEAETARHGSGQQAPAQRLTDFLAHKDSADLPRTSYTPGVVPSRLDKWLPAHIAARLAEACTEFNKRMRGFICDDALLVAIETRTSTPVRIVRDKDTLECVALKGLYPAGEGGGYAGGIVSSAMDGEKVSASIARKISRPAESQNPRI